MRPEFDKVLTLLLLVLDAGTSAQYPFVCLLVISTFEFLSESASASHPLAHQRREAFLVLS
jgi:hypothetical protein